MRPIHIIAFSICLFSFASCSSPKQDVEESSLETPVSMNLEDFVGDYVTEGYFKRDEKYDWTVIRILSNENGELVAEISSRSDLKRPSCRWKTTLTLNSEGILSTSFMEKMIHFEVGGDSLFIKGADAEAEGILSFFCNGGASLKNSYIKLKEPLDTSQISNFTFDQELKLQGITFEIKATEQNPYTTLSIETKGLEFDSTPIIHKIVGGYIESEIEDLNSDGWPEILIYFNSFGSEMKASLIGYSVNNGKSISQISMPEMSEAASTGYQGHDEFAIVETSLVRRFPVYNLEDGDWIPSGKTRQIQYKLRDGEASRQFYEVNITEY